MTFRGVEEQGFMLGIAHSTPNSKHLSSLTTD